MNGQPFAKGVGKGIVVIPAFGQGVIETEAITTLMGCHPAVPGGGARSAGDVRLSLAGKVKLRDHAFAFPFEMRGDTLWSTAPAGPTQ